MLIETKTYTDGTKATGAAPMPDLSPRQQEFVGMLDDVLESLRRGRVALEWSNQLDQVANVVRSMDQVREAIARIKCTPEQPAAAAVSDADVDRAAQIIANDRGSGWPHIPESWKQEFRETALAILALRPQAVPMTDEQVDSLAQVGAVYAPGGTVVRTPEQYRRELKASRVHGIRLAEAHHGITAQAKDGGA